MSIGHTAHLSNTQILQMIFALIQIFRMHLWPNIVYFDKTKMLIHILHDS